MFKCTHSSIALPLLAVSVLSQTVTIHNKSIRIISLSEFRSQKSHVQPIMGELTAKKDRALSRWDIWYRFGRNRIRKNGRISGQPEPDIRYIPNYYPARLMFYGLKLFVGLWWIFVFSVKYRLIDKSVFSYVNECFDLLACQPSDRDFSNVSFCIFCSVKRRKLWYSCLCITMITVSLDISTARLWVRVRSTDVYRVISLGKIFTPTRLG